MVDNIKETQVELKERRSSIDWIRTHRKQESKDSTSSADTQQSDLSHTERLAFELMNSSKSGQGDAPSPEKAPPKPQTSKPPVQVVQTSLTGKRPGELLVSAGAKKPPAHLRFAKELKKAAAPKSDHTPGQVRSLMFCLASLEGNKQVMRDRQGKRAKSGGSCGLFIQDYCPKLTLFDHF